MRRFAILRPSQPIAVLGAALAVGLGAVLAAPLAVAGQPGSERVGRPDQNTDETFATFKADAFGDKPIAAKAAFIRIDAPYRAEDAAVVPIDVEVVLPPGDERAIAKVTLVVDENPAPIAASFTLGQERKAFSISTRLRVNAYSTVRAVVETSDGGLAMNGKFVKASGGCAAPALKDQDEAMARIGETRFRAVAAGGDAAKPEANATRFDRAQLMIRHPNYSGLQMDQVKRTYIPAWFVNHVEVRQGDEMVFAMDGGISLSEDPMIRFSYLDKPEAGPLKMTGTDTQGKSFSAALKPGESAKAGGI